MGRCSYTWKEWDEEENKFAKKCCQKETWKDSDEFCIFHDPSSEKDVDLFKKMIEEQIESETERYDFTGYCFPEEWDFVNRDFELNTDFSEATFHGVQFNESVFQGIADFSGATFWGDAWFLGVDFKDSAVFLGVAFRGTAFFALAVFKDSCFTASSFLNNAEFEKTTFQGETDFGDASFRDAYFSGADFRDAGFTFANFHGTADFSRATFRYADFTSATFWNADFRATIFRSAYFAEIKVIESFEFTTRGVLEQLDFQEAKFFFTGSITANLKKAMFHCAYLQNIAFIDCEWPKNHRVYEEEHMNNEEINLSFSELETIYRNLKQNMQNHGDYSTAGELYYREMEMRRKGATRIRERAGLGVYKYLAGYGERYWNTAIVSTFIVSLFAILYGALDCLHYSVENPSLQQKIIDVIYFSFVTFTTLGLGDIAPATTLGKVLICIEAVIGAFMIAVFVVVFVRKMAR
jgi:uncharacterized protein YjbI with pentapeptide repeats